MSKELKLYHVVKMNTDKSKRPRLVQIISRPTPNNTIMVRMVPNVPGTLLEVPLSELSKPTYQYKYIHFAYISGRGTLPEDMLRYDNAKLYDHNQQEDPEAGYRPTDRVLVYQCTDRAKPFWTPARWTSFGWRVEPFRSERIEGV